MLYGCQSPLRAMLPDCGILTLLYLNSPGEPKSLLVLSEPGFSRSGENPALDTVGSGQKIGIQYKRWDMFPWKSSSRAIYLRLWSLDWVKEKNDEQSFHGTDFAG